MHAVAYTMILYKGMADDFRRMHETEWLSIGSSYLFQILLIMHVGLWRSIEYVG